MDEFACWGRAEEADSVLYGRLPKQGTFKGRLEARVRVRGVEGRGVWEDCLSKAGARRSGESAQSKGSGREATPQGAPSAGLHFILGAMESLGGF